MNLTNKKIKKLLKATFAQTNGLKSTWLYIQINVHVYCHIYKFINKIIYFQICCIVENFKITWKYPGMCKLIDELFGWEIYNGGVADIIEVKKN